VNAGRDPRLWLRLAALILLALGLTMPPIVTKRDVYDVIAVLDITGSMNAKDGIVGGDTVSRITMEKRAVRLLLAELPCGSRLGLGVFVEKQPFLMFEPVETCSNFSALDEEIAAVDWRMGWDSESHIADALLRAMEIARGLGADLVFMTDGQETPPLWWTGLPKFDGVRDSIHGVIEGVGGNKLVPIPKYDTNGHQIGVFKPSDVPGDRSGMFVGHENMTAVNAPHLRQLASLSGLAYRHLDSTNGLYRDVLAEAVPRRHQAPFDLSWSFAAAALALLLVAAILPDTIGEADIIRLH
jgi:mxaL protein